MRKKLNNKKCPVCKEELEEIIVTKTIKKYTQFDISMLQIYEEGVLYSDQSIKQELEEIDSLKCVIGHCRFIASNIISLKKHYKEEHSRYNCDVCSENKAEMFQETKLYSLAGFNRHMRHGDYDDDDNLLVFHPYC